MINFYRLIVPISGCVGVAIRVAHDNLVGRVGPQNASGSAVDPYEEGHWDEGQGWSQWLNAPS
jgi:hypothetical protein